MTASVYWRFYVTDSNYSPGGLWALMYELKLWHVDGNGVVSPLKPSTVTASGSYNASFGPEKALDNDPTNTCWQNNGAMPTWYRMVFDTAVEISAFAIYVGAYYNYGFKNFKLQRSDNDSDWVDVLSYTNFTGWVTTIANVFNLTPKYRVVRPRHLIRPDILHGGRFRLHGTISRDGSPVADREVWLHERQSNKPFRRAISAADGSYSFPWLAYSDKGYYVMAFDSGVSPYNAAVADLVTPEAMP